MNIVGRSKNAGALLGLAWRRFMAYRQICFFVVGHSWAHFAPLYPWSLLPSACRVSGANGLGSSLFCVAGFGSGPSIRFPRCQELLAAEGSLFRWWRLQGMGRAVLWITKSPSLPLSLPGSMAVTVCPLGGSLPRGPFLPPCTLSLAAAEVLR
eukprot:Gb_10206 [translate_table: standard]